MKRLCCSSSSFVCLCMWKLYIHDHHSAYLRGAGGSSRGRGGRSRLTKHPCLSKGRHKAHYDETYQNNKHRNNYTLITPDLGGASGSSRGRGRRSRLAKDIHAYQKNSIRHIPAKRSRNQQGGNSHKSSSGWIPPIVLIARDLADVLDALVGGVEAVKGWREERRKEREDRKNE